MVRLTGWDPETIRWRVPFAWLRVVMHAALMQDVEKEARDVKRFLG